ncbi:hypothetical protein [Dactylosporangium sp. CA-233914]
MIAAIRQRDPTAAEPAMRAHVAGVIEHLRGIEVARP